MSPSVIYLNCHDAGRWIQPHGAPVPTPHLQRFAEESVFFRNAHTVAPTCSPSRAGLLTGRYPHQAGMLGLAHRGFGLVDPSEHLARRLSRLGYETALSGEQHVASKRPVGSEEQFHDHRLTPAADLRGLDHAARDRLYAKRAAKFIEQHAGGDRPFYLECGFFFPHRPFPETSVDETTGDIAPPAYLPDTPRTRADMSAYATAMRSADACFGIVIDALRRTGLDRRAIIVVTTDHGPAFPWAKCNLNDEGTGVMLMMRLPQITAPRVVDAMVTHLDILPTINEALGQPEEPGLEGRSLLPLLREETAAVHEEIFAEVTFHAAYEPMRSVRTDRYRYIRRFMGDWLRPVLPNIDDGPSRRELHEAGLGEQPLPAESLHDLERDPFGAVNLAEAPEHAALLADLRGRLNLWMVRTRDPLLSGEVRVPSGAVITPRDAWLP